MDHAVKQLGFDLQSVLITLGTLVAVGAITLLVMQIIKIFRELRNPKLIDEKSIRDKLESDHERL